MATTEDGGSAMAPTADVAAPVTWTVPQPEHLPEPTYWPAVLAFGITMTLWGIVTSAIILVTGLLVAAIALGGWIGDLRHER